MPSSAPSRFSGISNASKTEVLGSMGQLDPTRFNTLFEDFNYSGDLVAAAPLNWTVTKVGTGTLAAGNEEGGSVLITNTAGATDQISAQVKTLPFVINPAKRSWFSVRFKLSDVNLSSFLIGLTNADTTPLGAAASEETGVTDGIFFYKDTATTDMRFATRKASATFAQKTGIIVPVNATYLVLGWEFVPASPNNPGGVEEFRLFSGDTLFVQPPPLGRSDRGTVQLTSISAPSATALPVVALSPNLSIRNGEAVAKTLSIDWIFAAQER
jgi:hypothetical protein